MKKGGSSANLVRIAILTALYIAAGKFGLSLAFVHANATAVWPPAGIALAAFLLLGYGVWPAIFVGAFVVNITTAGSIASSVGIAIGNTGEGLIGAYLVNTFANGPYLFGRAQDIFKFAFLAALLSTTVSASIGVASLVLTGYASWENIGPIWTTWWVGDAVGDLVIAPLVILWWLNPRPRLKREQAIEALILLFVLVAVSEAVFGNWYQSIVQSYPLSFMCVPFLIWAAFRFSPRETAVAVAVVSGIAIASSLQGVGPFVVDTQNASLLLLQTFMGINAVMALALASVVSEDRRTKEALQQTHQELEQRVKDRTADLTRAIDSLHAEIVERRRTEKKLEDSQRRMVEAQQIAHVGSWQWDIASNVITWSDELFRLYGVEPQSIPLNLEAFRSRVHPDDRQNVASTIEQSLRDHRPFDFEHRVVWDDGSVHWVHGRGEVALDDKGIPVRMTGTSQDIDGRKRAERQIAESQKELREFIDHMTTMNAKVATDGTLIVVNRLAEMAAGIPHEELMNTKFTEGPWWSFDPSVQARVRDVFRRTVSGETINYDEQLFVFGKVITINLSLSPVFDESGRVSYVLAEGRDITSQKQAEEALRQSEERYRTLVSGVKDYAIYGLDLEGNILTWNAGAESIEGYKAEEVIGKPISIFFPPEDLRDGKPEKFLARARAEGRAEDEGWRVRKDDMRFWANVILAPVQDPNGEIVGFTKIVRDLTDRNRAENFIRKSEELYRDLVENANDIIYRVDVHGKITFCNPTAFKILKYVEEEIIGRHYLDFVKPEYRNSVERYFKVQFAQKTANTYYEAPAIDKDGREVWLGQHVHLLMEDGQ